MTSINGLRCPQEACNIIVFGADSKRLMKHHNQPQYHGARFPQGPGGYEKGRGFHGWPQPEYDNLKREGFTPCQECPYDGCTTIIMGNDWKTLMKFHTDCKHGSRFEETNLGRLPLEILIKIIWYDMPESFECQQRYFLSLASVCKKLNEVIKCPELYRELNLPETRALSVPFFKKMIRDCGSQLRKFTCGGKNERLLLPTLKKCGDTLREVHVNGKTPVGIADRLVQISKLNPTALKHLQFNDITRTIEGNLALTLDQRNSDEHLISRIVGLTIDFDGIRIPKAEALKHDDYRVKKWEAMRTKVVRLVALAVCGIQTLQKVSVRFCNHLGVSEQLMGRFKEFLGKQDSLSLYQFSYSELREVQPQQAWKYPRWVCDMTWKNNGKLPQKNPSEAFKTFLQGLREIK